MEQWLALHEQQLISSNIPDIFWGSLYLKLSNETFDAGKYFEIVQDEDDELHVVVKSSDDPAASYEEDGTILEDTGSEINPEDPNHIFLVDHAWTFTMKDARQHLTENKSLLDRVSSMLPINDKEGGKCTVDDVICNIWAQAEMYTIASKGNVTGKTFWYFNDEFGSLIEHSDTPVMAMAPFIDVKTQLAFTILWPLESIRPGAVVSRDKLFGCKDIEKRVPRLYGLFPEQYGELLENMCANDSLQNSMKTLEIASGRDAEILPNCSLGSSVQFPNRTWRVYSDLELFRNNLSSKRFELVSSRSSADIIWEKEHIKDFNSLEQDRSVLMINQFPNEKIVTCKDLLYVSLENANCGKRPKWLPKTYNMDSELAELMADFKYRKENGLDNHWICKPWNLARSIDITVCNTSAALSKIVNTGPKIASKYIHDPVLVGGKKFDMRFIVLLKSTDPLIVYLYKPFWLRFANKPFALHHLDDYEVHFTVMNYNEHEMKQVGCEEFKCSFENEYPKHSWNSINAKIHEVVLEMFVLLSKNAPPCGLKGNFPKCRSMFGIDMMLEWDSKKNEMNPMVLEANYQPDCTRACKYYPNFFNDVVSALTINDFHKTCEDIILLE